MRSKKYTPYFAVAPRTDEFNAVKIAQPQSILVSYALWRNKPLQYLIDAIGYRPESIILDSGAYTFYNRHQSNGLEDLLDSYLANDDDEEMTNEDVARELMFDIYHDGHYHTEVDPLPRPLFLEFYFYWEQNQQYIDHVITLDTIGDQEMTFIGYEILRDMGMRPLPVFGYGQPLEDLEELVASGARYVALGGSVMERRKKVRLAWVKNILQRYPQVDFHLLGCLDGYILRQLPGLVSSDGNAWKISASKYGRAKVEKCILAIHKFTERSFDNVS